MEVKKSPKADLEKKKGLYMEIGLVFTLVILWLAFEWKSYDRLESKVITQQAVTIEEDMIIQTSQEAPPPPPPPSTISQEIDVVDDDVELENDDFNFDVEADEKTAVEPTLITMPAVEEETVAEEEIFQIVEEYPSFPGGEEAIAEYLRKNLRYPHTAQESGIQGRVYVGFVVEKDGSVSNVKVLRGIGGGCDEEAIKAVKSMPKWSPGKQRGKNVRCTYSIPIVFNLG